MKHSRSAGAILIGPTNQIAVVSQHGTSWSLVKGTLEKGEDNLTALKREVEEETGITQFEVIKDLESYERYIIGIDGGEDRSERKTITLFLCTTKETKLEPQDPHNPEARWVDPNKVATMLTHPKDKQAYTNHLSKVEELISNRRNSR